ncbi:MAG: hypothetical protein ACYTG2_14660 [Planctomycetota bacterium]|jgi:hypothetical protein
MATIFRALLVAVLVLFAGVVWTGLGAAGHAGSGDPGEALALHLRFGLLAALVAVFAQSVPFAYFLGTGFWIRAFARASRAGPDWEARHRAWMTGRAYKWMYAAPFAAAATAITGGLAETGRLATEVHVVCVLAAVAGSVVALVLVPREMRRNSALMDELADHHQVPRPDTPQMEELLAEEEKAALPPLFQLSRVLLYAGAQVVIVWLYLRFGTEGWRGTPLLPFGAAAVVLLTLGLGLNARHDPQSPRTAAVAWGRAMAVGVVCAGLLAAVVVLI